MHQHNLKLYKAKMRETQRKTDNALSGQWAILTHFSETGRPFRHIIPKDLDDQSTGKLIKNPSPKSREFTSLSRIYVTFTNYDYQENLNISRNNEIQITPCTIQVKYQASNNS